MTDVEKMKQMANAIRALSMDAVQQAKSGHPGMPMGMADVATVLFTQFLKFDPRAPKWPDRDRFVLSAGHGSMLLYALLHLTGYEDMTLDEIKNFRQLGAKTAGHPEYGHASGIETTTGPLGQGIATAVGMALAERILNAEYGDEIVDHFTYVIASDGDLMEGISHEAISLAGHYQLSKMIVLFDDNGISIDGPISLSESGDQMKRFEAAGWDVQSVDGHDPEGVARAIEQARETDKPSLIACKTVIGFGSPNKSGKASSHGAPLGTDEIAETRKALGWSHAPFEIPENILDAWRIAGLRSGHARIEWEKRHDGMDVETKAEFDRRCIGELPAKLNSEITAYKATLAEEKPTVATRKASEMALTVINAAVPETVGGSADLTGSNNTLTADMHDITAEDYSGRYMRYGIREHGMAAAMNGMALHGGLIPYSGGFLIFSDYCRASIRLAALMGVRAIHVLTHDSIGLGEDGPTHQPVEHLASLRAMPNLNVFRPADAMETVECWQLALMADRTPSSLALTRQGLPAARTEFDEENRCAKGAYTLAGFENGADAVIFASGSEVELALEAKVELDKKGIPTRVVSVPCFELFEAQDEDYKTSLLGSETIRVGVEAAVRMGWDRFIGSKGTFIGMTSFGASAPYKQVYEHFGITTDAIVAAVENQNKSAHSENDSE
ncbi:MAG: transketolase [Pseudomonadota bacterium]